MNCRAKEEAGQKAHSLCKKALLAFGLGIVQNSRFEVGCLLGGDAPAGVSCRVQLGAYIMIHVLIALGSRVPLAMLARLGAGKVGTLGAWSSGPYGVSSTLPSFKRPVWILEPKVQGGARFCSAKITSRRGQSTLLGHIPK